MKKLLTVLTLATVLGCGDQEAITNSTSAKVMADTLAKVVDVTEDELSLQYVKPDYMKEVDRYVAMGYEQIHVTSEPKLLGGIGFDYELMTFRDIREYERDLKNRKKSLEKFKVFKEKYGNNIIAIETDHGSTYYVGKPKSK
jgi:hypothetical protein